MSINYMIYGPYEDITKEQYFNWLENSKIIENERPTFTSFCGPHDFSTIISKSGMLYDLGWGWYPEEGQTIDWYGVIKLSKENGQFGEGI